MKLKFFTYKDGGWAANCHLVIDEDSKTAAVFDASASPEKIKSKLDTEGVVLKYIILTHGHFDHMLQLEEMRDMFPDAELCIHKGDEECLFDSEKNYFLHFTGLDRTFKKADRLLDDGDVLNLGEAELKFMHTPGHTKGSVCCVIGNSIVTGDTLFDGDIGRCDLLGGDLSQLRTSLKKLAKLGETGEDYKLYTGHGSTGRLIKEIQTNPYMK